MYQKLSSLNLPDFKVQDYQTRGYWCCKDVDVDAENSNGEPELKELTDMPKTKTALDVYQEECTHGAIVTSISQLDEVLGGGVPTGCITEFCGEPGAGKTQLCYYLSVNVQLPAWCGGMAAEAVYVGTNQGFASHRLREIATACVRNYIKFKTKHSAASSSDGEFNVESIMQKIHYISVNDHVELLAFVKYFEKWLENHSPVCLVIIDSISAPLKAVDFREKTQIIYRVFKDLQRLAQKYRFAIVVTNDLTTRIHSANSTYQTPSLGGSYYHRINARVQLAKTSTNTFSATVLKNVLRPLTTVKLNLFS